MTINKMTREIKKEIRKLKREVVKIAKDVGLIRRSTNSFYNKEEDFLLFILFNTINLHNGVSLSDLSFRLQDNFNIKMKRQGIDYKLSEEKTAKFLRKVFNFILMGKFNKISIFKESGLFEEFANVYIEDSTILGLLDVHKDIFKGLRSKVSAIKVNLFYDVFHQNILDVGITGANKNDQGHSMNMLHYVNKNTLLIRDLGYFKLLAFKEIADNGGYFLSRYFYPTLFRREKMQETLTISDIISETENKEFYETEVLVGSRVKVPARLILHKMNEEEYKKRLERVEKATKKRDNKEISEEYKEVLKYNIFITNIPKEKIDGKDIGTLYKYRWEIELVIKELKSFIGLKDIAKTVNKNKMKSILYARLTTALILFMFKNLASLKAKEENREVSNTRLINWLLQENKLLNTIRMMSFTKFMKSFNESASLMYMEKRKRKSMRYNIKEKVEFTQSFEKRDASEPNNKN